MAYVMANFAASVTITSQPYVQYTKLKHCKAHTGKLTHEFNYVTIYQKVK